MKLVLTLFLFSAVCFSADTPAFRMAYVDLQKALQTVEAGRTAKSSLEKEVSAKRAELEKMQQQLQKEAEQFEKKAAILNESARTTKQVELQKKFVDFQKNAAESQAELQKRERELTKPLIDELRAIIEVIGKEKNFQLILEKNESAVLYSEATNDLTSDVVERFNKAHKSKKKE